MYCLVVPRCNSNVLQLKQNCLILNIFLLLCVMCNWAELFQVAGSARGVRSFNFPPVLLKVSMLLKVWHG